MGRKTENIAEVIAAERAGFEKQLKKLRDKLAAKEDELKKLRKENMELKEQLAEYKELVDGADPGSEAMEAPDSYFVEQLRLLSQTQRIVIAGGSADWQAKMLQEFPGLGAVNSKNFDPAAVKAADIVIINTNNVSHALTRKAQNEAGPETHVVLTSKYNIDRLARDIVMQVSKKSREPLF